MQRRYVATTWVRHLDVLYLLGKNGFLFGSSRVWFVELPPSVDTRSAAATSIFLFTMYFFLFPEWLSMTRRAAKRERRTHKKKNEIGKSAERK